MEMDVRFECAIRLRSLLVAIRCMRWISKPFVFQFSMCLFMLEEASEVRVYYILLYMEKYDD